MALQFFEINDKPAYRIDSAPGIPFVLQYNDEGEKEWTPNYDASFGHQAMPISEAEFRELAGDMAKRMRTKI